MSTLGYDSARNSCNEPHMSKQQGRAQLGQLPANPVKYVKRLEEPVECLLALLSTSPDRDDTILVKDPFVD